MIDIGVIRDSYSYIRSIRSNKGVIYELLGIFKRDSYSYIRSIISNIGLI